MTHHRKSYRCWGVTAPSRWIDPTFVGRGWPLPSGVVYRIIIIWVSISPFRADLRDHHHPRRNRDRRRCPLDRHCRIRDRRDRGGGPHHPCRGSLVIVDAVMIVLFRRRDRVKDAGQNPAPRPPRHNPSSSEIDTGFATASWR
jgi:hypothetical protein